MYLHDSIRRSICVISFHRRNISTNKSLSAKLYSVFFTGYFLLAYCIALIFL